MLLLFPFYMCMYVHKNTKEMTKYINKIVTNDQYCITRQYIIITNIPMSLNYKVITVMLPDGLRYRHMEQVALSEIYITQCVSSLLLMDLTALRLSLEEKRP